MIPKHVKMFATFSSTAQLQPPDPLAQGRVTVSMAASGTMWRLDAANGTIGVDLKRAASKATGLPEPELQLLSSDFTPLQELVVAVTEESTDFFLVRIGRTQLHLECRAVSESPEGEVLGEKLTDLVIEDALDTQWSTAYNDLVKQLESVFTGGNNPIFVWTQQGQQISCPENSGQALYLHKGCRDLARVSVGTLFSVANVEDIDIEQEKQRMQQVRDGRTQQQRNEIEQKRLALLGSGKAPCGVDFCDCENFHAVVGQKTGTGEVYCQTCMHTMSKHLGEKFAPTISQHVGKLGQWLFSSAFSRSE